MYKKGGFIHFYQRPYPLFYRNQEEEPLESLFCQILKIQNAIY
jgi:hypothetical protein